MRILWGSPTLGHVQADKLWHGHWLCTFILLNKKHDSIQNTKSLSDKALVTSRHLVHSSLKISCKFLWPQYERFIQMIRKCPIGKHCYQITMENSNDHWWHQKIITDNPAPTVWLLSLGNVHTFFPLYSEACKCCLVPFSLFSFQLWNSNLGRYSLITNKSSRNYHMRLCFAG